MNNKIKPKGNFGVPSADVSPGTIPANFTLNMPQGLVMDKFNNIWTADTGNNRIIIFNPQLNEIIQVFGSLGSSKGKFNMPFRLAAHPDKNWIYVTDMNNNRVQVLEYNSAYKIKVKKIFGKHGYGEGEFNGPNGITVVKENGIVRVCVSDEFAWEDTLGRILIFDENGCYLKKIHEVSNPIDPSKPVDMLWPQGLSGDSEGRIYICDVGNARIIRSDLNGNGIPFSGQNTASVTITGKETAYGSFLYPRGVKIIHDRIFIEDNGWGIVAVYNLNGVYIGSITKSPAASFYGPIEACQSSLNENFVIINENAAPKISVYDITNLSAAATVYTVGNYRLNSGQFSYVTSVINKNQDSYYIIDCFNIRIQTWQFASGQFNYLNNRYLSFTPSCINVLKNNEKSRYFITDTYAATVHVYDENFSLIQNFGQYPTLYLPRSIRLQNNRIFITNTGLNQISVWDYNLDTDTATHVTNFGSSGNGDGQFTSPMDMTIDDTGNIAVTDQMNNRVQIFDSSFNYISQFGQFGYDDPDLCLPTSIFYKNNAFYVTDLITRSIKVFNLSGEFLYKYHNFGCEKGGMWMPYMLYLTDDYLLLPDGSINRINYYKYQTKHQGEGMKDLTGKKNKVAEVLQVISKKQEQKQNDFLKNEDMKKLLAEGFKLEKEIALMKKEQKPQREIQQKQAEIEIISQKLKENVNIHTLFNLPI